MKIWIPWKIAQKELKVITRKKSVILYIIIFPLLISIGFSYLAGNIVGSSSQYQLGFDSLTYVFVVLAAFLPTTVAAYSIVGEKIEKTLEPLLATPVTDSQILMGKSIAAFLPTIISIWASSAIFMGLSDSFTHKALTFYYFPNWNAGVMLVILAPLSAITGIGLAVILSSKVTDVRGANQLGALVWIPFMVVFVAAIQGKIVFNVPTILAISSIVLIADIILFYLSSKTFNREDILTKWK